jgi:hypothetical protein
MQFYMKRRQPRHRAAATRTHFEAPTGVLSSTHHGKVVAILNFHSQLITRGFHPSLSIQAA